VSVVTHLLNRSLHVWRPSQAADGSGGFTVTYIDRGAIHCQVSEAPGTEQLTAAQLGASHTHNIYCEPDADVFHNDKLAPTGVDPNTPGTSEVYRVMATTVPSTSRYLKAECEREERA